jgi:hypothetical protein
MVPSTIRSNLSSLRRRERLLTFVWGAACWLAVALVLLVICCFVDWLIDRWQDTPMTVRVGLVGVQLASAFLAGILFLMIPQFRRLPDALLALWVEDRVRDFDHRLISAVQLNAPGADLGGMSKELVGIVTREAEKRAARVGFASVADHRRLKWSAFVLAPVVLLTLLPLAVWPNVSFALLARQGLLDVEIPHSVYLESVSAEVWPMNESIKLRFRVTGEWNEDMVGRVRVTPIGQPADTYDLVFMQRDDQGAVFEADVQPALGDITYSARIYDGRTKRPSEMKVVPRPTVINNLAWVLLPEYCGKRPDGGRYEQPQGRGDVVGIPGSSVRVQVTIQKEITEAWLELRGPEINPEAKDPDDEKMVKEVPLEKTPRKMTLASDGMSAELQFELTPNMSGYRVIVKDQYGFDNNPYPRRSLRLMPEEPPQVLLLRDTFGFGADFDLEGLPVILGKQIRIPYVCYGTYGLGKAQILYRVLKKHESGNEPMEDEPWIRLPLPEIVANDDTGPFDPKTGVFSTTRFDQQVPFHAVPSIDPMKILGRTLGGGRYFLETDGLIDSKGITQKLKSGDQIEYCVEVFATHREPAGTTPVARSESRVATMMRSDEFFAWMQAVGREDERVKLLELRQKGVFQRK